MTLPGEGSRVRSRKPFWDIVLVPQFDAIDRRYLGYVRGELVDHPGTHFFAGQFRGDDEQLAPLIGWDHLAKDA